MATPMQYETEVFFLIVLGLVGGPKAWPQPSAYSACTKMLSAMHQAGASAHHPSPSSMLARELTGLFLNSLLESAELQEKRTREDRRGVAQPESHPPPQVIDGGFVISYESEPLDAPIGDFRSDHLPTLQVRLQRLQAGLAREGDPSLLIWSSQDPLKIANFLRGRFRDPSQSAPSRLPGRREAIEMTLLGLGWLGFGIPSARAVSSHRNERMQDSAKMAVAEANATGKDGHPSQVYSIEEFWETFEKWLAVRSAAPPKPWTLEQMRRTFDSGLFTGAGVVLPAGAFLLGGGLGVLVAEKSAQGYAIAQDRWTKLRDGLSLAYACPPLLPFPALEKILELVRTRGIHQNAPQRFFHFGINNHAGRHLEIMLQSQRAGKEAKFQFVAVGWQTPFDYWPPSRLVTDDRSQKQKNEDRLQGKPEPSAADVSDRQKTLNLGLYNILRRLPADTTPLDPLHQRLTAIFQRFFKITRLTEEDLLRILSAAKTSNPLDPTELHALAEELERRPSATTAQFDGATD